MSEEKIDAWMPLWIGRYLGSTMSLNTTQHGAYLLLLIAYWRRAAPLVDDDDTLRSITKSERAEWKKIRGRIAIFFQIENGVWRHQHLEEELKVAAKHKSAAVAKAKAGALARWGKDPKDASSIHQPLPEDIDKQCSSPSPSPSPSPILGIQADKTCKNSVCDSPHTPISDEFRTVIRTARPELDADAVYAVFVGHYPLEKRTLAKWQQWLKNERAPMTGAHTPGTSDPDSRASVEAMGVTKGLGKWNQAIEHWAQYKARVRGQSKS